MWRTVNTFNESSILSSALFYSMIFIFYSKIVKIKSIALL